MRHRSRSREAHNEVMVPATLVATAYTARRFVEFSLNRVRMLIHFGVTPYLVFDGDYLPSKAATEAERATRRKESKRIGLELYKLGKPSQAHKELQKAVDVTPEMAGQLIVELKKLGVQYVVAPYEADAQLAYLERKGLIQGILSEDSDLLVFGAKCLLTKLDQYGDCIEINRNDFTACRDISLVGWSDAEFRLMAILSGCDYLPSINNMGLLTAYRFVRKHKTIEKILRLLQFDGKYHVPTGYLEAFQRAELTFLCQRVFCPISNDLSMAADAGAKAGSEDLAFIGARMEKEIVIKVACGDLHPMTKEPLRIPGLDAASPRTPLGNVSRQRAVKLTDMKENKSIESFFKAKRMPLGELDPNSFTASPSQQRLQQRVNGTWMSSPALARPPFPESSVSLPTSSPQVGNPVNNRQMSVSAPHPPPKRRRLCSDPADEQNSSLAPSTGQDGRSRFFTSTKSELTTGTIKTRKKKAATADIHIWSDDSIEDVMAGLPDVAGYTDTAVKPKKPPVFQDSEEFPIEAPSVTAIGQAHGQSCLPGFLRDESSVHDSQSSISSRATNLSEASVGTAATSVSSSTQTGSQVMDDHVTAELAALRQQSSYAPPPKSTPQQRHPDDHKIKPGDYQRALQASGKPRLLRHGSLTPLQRLGANALHRSRSWSGSTRSTPKQAVDWSSANTRNGMRGPQLTPQSTTESYIPSPESDHILATGLEPPPIKGSEDLIIPDSEEEASDALSCSGVEEPRKPTVNLGRFAFSG